MPSDIQPLEAADTALRLPAGFADFLDRHALPVPPLTLTAMSLIEAVDADVFSTGENPERLQDDWLDDLEAALEPVEDFNRGECRHALFAVMSRGLQSSRVVLRLDEGGLRLGLSLPWSNAWGEPEVERETLLAAYKIAQCLLCAVERPGLLTVLISPQGIFWKDDDESGSITGDDLQTLLDRIDTDPAADLPFNQWIPV